MDFRFVWAGFYYQWLSCTMMLLRWYDFLCPLYIGGIDIDLDS